MTPQRPNLKVSVEEVARNLRRFVAPGDVTEIRVPKAGRAGTISGFFDDLDKAAAAAVNCSGKAQGVYFVLNVVNPALLARACNRLAEWAQHTTGDADVTRRRWLFVDLDPVRPSGISSTDEEHRAAHALAQTIRTWLAGRGWPDGVYADSGNGAHLLYRVDLDNDDAAALLLSRCLQALGKEFDNKDVAVDRSTANAGHLGKCYGTAACKGDSTVSRPPRLSRVVEAPEHVLPVPAEKLRALADSLPPEAAAPPAAKKRAAGKGPPPRLKVEEWLNDRGIGFRRKEKADGTGRTIFALDRCPFNEGHGKDSCLMQSPDGKMGAKCLHSSCSNHRWQDFKQALGPPDPDHYDPPLSKKGGKKGRRKKGAKGKDIILDYFKTHYRPVFKRGNGAHCGDGALLTQPVACGVPDSALIDRLAKAADVPRTESGAVKWAALPKFFTTWAKVSWGDLLDGLPTEDDVAPGDDGPGRAECRQLVRDALLSEVVLGKTIRGSHVTEVERRSLIDWCGKFAKDGVWRSIRSKRCWCRLKKLEGGEVELQVAVRHELFGQLKADKRLADLTANAFGRRAARYGVGTSTREERPHGLSAVVLDPAFIRELTAGAPADPVEPDQPVPAPEREPGEEG
jgi:hypothetical protein